MLLNGLRQHRQAGLGDQMVFRLPLLIVEQIVLKTAKADTVPAEDIPRLQPSAEEQIHQKLITIGAQPLLTSRLLGIEVAFHFGRDAAERKGCCGLLTEGAPLPPHRLQKLDGLQEGIVEAVGTGRILDNGQKVPMELTVGDKVLYAKYAGNEFKLEDVEYLIISEKDVLAVVANGK